MAAPHMKLDTEKLRRKMEDYSKVTGKSISSTMRRQARLLAVSLAFNTPPFGKDPSARKKGENATVNDILRLFLPLKELPGKLNHATQGLRGMAERMSNRSLGDAIKAAIDQASVPGKGRKKSAAKAKALSDLSVILGNAGKFKRYTLVDRPDPGLHKNFRDSSGRIRRRVGVKTVIADTPSLASFIAERQQRVGMTKAAWAACAIAVKADVKNSLAGIPAWVKRHAAKVPHSVTDKTDGAKPDIVLTSKLPWADKALRSSEYNSAIRIAQEKFYRAMSKEIKETLKASHA